MHRKRLLSILSAATLSLAALAGPAVALDAADAVGEQVETVASDGIDGELDTEETQATAEVGDTTVTVAPTDADDPVQTDADDALTDPALEPLDDGEAGSTAPSDGGDEPAASNDGVRGASGDTEPAPAPAEPERGTARMTPRGLHQLSFATQRPAPSAVAAPEVAEPAELAPEVAPPRPAAPASGPVDLAATPITDPAQAPAALKVLAAMLVAGTALSWWNANELTTETVTE